MFALLATLGYGLLGVAAGASFVVQSTVNARLRTNLQSPFWAAFISYLGGTLTMAVIVLAAREPWLRATTVVKSDWWAWSGGFFGAVYVVISILLLPRLGVATVVSTIVAGQMLTSMIFDHFGLFGVVRHPAAGSRLLGAAFLIVGVALIRR